MKKLVALVVALFCAPATAAWAAGGSTMGGYGGEGKAQGLVQKAGTGAGHGTLPFTGLSLTIVVVVGALLIVTGLLMRRRHHAGS